jgi:hypothetical protein
VTIKNGARRVGDRIVLIVAFRQRWPAAHR